MKQRTSLCLILFATAILSGCAATTPEDPCKGGLFGYDAAACEQKLANKQQVLTELEEENRSSTQKSQQLESSKGQLLTEQSELNKKLAGLNDSIRKLEKKLDQQTIANSSNTKELKELQQQLNTLKQESAMVGRMESGKEQMEELERLKKKKALLEKDILELLTM
ncbi:hypothetical protein [Desulfogranum japonicum]|uniref:hypothetical protein n=1 Tax=Desulfogranum japonicum TaxID=231447 RepID=UPI0003F83738|nr:hypothetical protein [Desulfogranum japonicum]